MIPIYNDIEWDSYEPVNDAYDGYNSANEGYNSYSEYLSDTSFNGLFILLTRNTAF